MHPHRRRGHRSRGKISAENLEPEALTATADKQLLKIF